MDGLVDWRTLKEHSMTFFHNHPPITREEIPLDVPAMLDPLAYPSHEEYRAAQAAHWTELQQATQFAEYGTQYFAEWELVTHPMDKNEFWLGFLEQYKEQCRLKMENCSGRSVDWLRSQLRRRLKQFNLNMRDEDTMETFGRTNTLCVSKSTWLVDPEVKPTQVFYDNKSVSLDADGRRQFIQDVTSGADNTAFVLALGLALGPSAFDTDGVKDERSNVVVPYEELEVQDRPVLPGTTHVDAACLRLAEEALQRTIGDDGRPTHSIVDFYLRPAASNRSRPVTPRAPPPQNAAECWRNRCRLLTEIPFSTENCWCFQLFEDVEAQRRFAVVRGQPEHVWRMCCSMRNSDVETGRGREDTIKPEWERAYENALQSMEARGLKCVAVAWKFCQSLTEVMCERAPFTFVGLVGLQEVIRPDLGPYLEKCSKLRLNVVMFTNDSVGRAEAVGKELGFLTGTTVQDLCREKNIPNAKALTEMEIRRNVTSYVLSGPEVDLLRESDWDDLLGANTEGVVFARCTSRQRAVVVRNLRDRGHVVTVAATDDRMLDAVQAADSGIACGPLASEELKSACGGTVEDGDLCSIIFALDYIRRAKACQYPAATYGATSPSRTAVPAWKMLLKEQQDSLKEVDDAYSHYQRNAKAGVRTD